MPVASFTLIILAIIAPEAIHVCMHTAVIFFSFSKFTFVKTLTKMKDNLFLHILIFTANPTKHRHFFTFWEQRQCIFLEIEMWSTKFIDNQQTKLAEYMYQVDRVSQGLEDFRKVSFYLIKMMSKLFRT